MRFLYIMLLFPLLTSATCSLASWRDTPEFSLQQAERECLEMPGVVTDSDRNLCIEEKAGGHGALLGMTWFLRVFSVVNIALLFVYLVYIRKAAFARGPAS